LRTGRFAELRARAEAALGRKVNMLVWRSVPKRFKKAADNRAPYAIEELLEEIRRLEKWLPDRGPTTRPSSGPYEAPRLAEHEQERSRVLTTHFGRLADRMDSVVKFRQRHLNGELLSRNDAEAFLRSRAYQLMSAEQVEQAGLPIPGLRSEEEARSVEDFVLSDRSRAFFVFYRLRCYVGNGRPRIHRVRVPILEQSNEPPTRPLEIEFANGSGLGLQILSGSVIDGLRASAKFLVDEFRWPFSGAALFILTGEVPPRPGIAMEVSSREGLFVTQARITMEIQPWVSADAVRRVYQHARRWAAGPRVRSLSTETLRLFEGCAAAILKTPPETWKAIAEAQRRDGRIKRRVTWRQCRRDFFLAKQRLLRPNLLMGQDPKKFRRRKELEQALLRARSYKERSALMDGFKSESNR